jgi:hypothetical protein
VAYVTTPAQLRDDYELKSRAGLSGCGKGSNLRVWWRVSGIVPAFALAEAT